MHGHGGQLAPETVKIRPLLPWISRIARRLQRPCHLFDEVQSFGRRELRRLPSATRPNRYCNRSSLHPNSDIRRQHSTKAPESILAARHEDCQPRGTNPLREV